jgi:hypothetical protein
MNEMDLLSRLRDEVPLGVSPRAEHLFRTALLDSQDPGRAAAPSRRSRRPGARVPWRPVVAVSVAVAVGAAVAVVVLPAHGRVPAGHPAAPVTLLADRAAAAALDQPSVRPGQWVYRETEMSGQANKSEKQSSEELWSTADDTTEASYYDGKLGLYYRDRDNNGVMGPPDFYPVPLSYRSLGSLPARPGALVARLAEIGARAGTGEPVGCAQSTASCTAFLAISELLSSYVMPPALTAELYQALGDIPGVSVVPGVDVDGQACTGFRIPLTGGDLELIVNAATYQYVATLGSFPGGGRGTVVVARQALVSGPGVRP